LKKVKKYSTIIAILRVEDLINILDNQTNKFSDDIKEGKCVMRICLNCGKEDQNWICERCKTKVDVEELCSEINTYNSQEKVNKIFETVISRTNYNEFKNIVYELTEKLEAPKKEMLIIDSLTGYKKFYEIFYNKREMFYNSANICLNNSNISQEDKNYILDVLFVNNFKDYNYEETERLANLIKDRADLNKYVIYELGKYYIYTRRYDLAKKFLEKRIALIDENDNEKIQNAIKKSYEDIEKRQNREMKEYMPLASENQEKYCQFMNSIGFNLDRIELREPQRRSIQPKKIAPKDYPNIKENEITDFNFDTFVAFDLETTGLGRKYSETAKNRKIDDIIEIAAIKVVDGKIDESKKFTFQELVHPMKQKINKDVEELTGITNQMVYDAEQIWDVFPRFMEFVGNNILVGFNCIAFDCDFLVRAGRYSEIIIKNKFFDIYRNLSKFDIKNSNLAELSKTLNIENAKAHRALADAITTAKVFMKLKEKNKKSVINKIDKPTKSKAFIKIIGGTNQESDSIEEIWENLIVDCEKKEEAIIKKLMEECTDNIEKPIYSPTVEIVNKNEKITVNELWTDAKVMLFLSENEEEYNIAKETGWNCFIINEEFDIKEFLRSIKK